METLRCSVWPDHYPDKSPFYDSIRSPNERGGHRSVPRISCVGHGVVCPRMVVIRASAANGKESVKGSEGAGNESVLDIIRGGVSAEGKKPWWAPIFGMQPSSNNDHKTSTVATNVTTAAVGCGSLEVAPEANPKVPRRAVFTAKKARLLRKELRATETWHDLMYHSAIASRLAFPDDL
eukprot:Gb_00704 [translate_table: standard]